MSGANEVTMPQLGETVAEGTVTRWLKRVGEAVAEGEALVEIATDKVDTEIPAPTAGTVLEILVEEDSTVPVGTLLARLGVRAPQIPDMAAGAAPVALRPPVVPAAPSAPAMRPVGGLRHVSSPRMRRHVHSPRMRRLAESTHVDLSMVTGTGPGGRLVEADVRAAAHAMSAPVTAQPVVPVVPVVPTASVLAVTMLLEIDVTHLRSVPEPDAALLAAVAAETMSALRLSGAVAGRAVPDLEVNGQVIPRGGDLTVRALSHLVNADALSVAVPPVSAPLAAASAGPSAPRSRITVHGTPASAALVQIPALAPGCLCAIGVGNVRQGPVVLADRLRGPVIGIGALATLAVTYDPAVLAPATATKCVNVLVQRLADPALARELAG